VAGVETRLVATSAAHRQICWFPDLYQMVLHRPSELARIIGKVAPSTLREKEVGEFCTETKGPGQFSWLVLPIVATL
jgi:hypothetical protein